VIGDRPGRLTHPLHEEAQNQIEVLSATNANSYTARQSQCYTQIPITINGLAAKTDNPSMNESTNKSTNESTNE